MMSEAQTVTEGGGALAVRPQAALMPVDEAMSYGKLLASSGYFQDAREAAQAAVKVLAGAEMGVPPFQAMTGINIIKGKPSMGAALMAAQIKKSGKYDYRVIELTDAKCVIRFFQRAGSEWEPIGDSAITLVEAKKLANNSDMYAKAPRNMLFARALSNGAKWYTPDIFGGAVYVPEEFPNERMIEAQVESTVEQQSPDQAVGQQGEVIDATITDTAPAEAPKSAPSTTSAVPANGKPVIWKGGGSCPGCNCPTGKMHSTKCPGKYDDGTGEAQPADDAAAFEKARAEAMQAMAGWCLHAGVSPGDQDKARWIVAYALGLDEAIPTRSTLTVTQMQDACEALKAHDADYWATVLTWYPEHTPGETRVGCF
jgi:hypothetical protein